MMDEIHGILGAHGEAIETLKTDMRITKDSVLRIEKKLAHTEGGLKAAIGIASIGGAVGAAIVKGLAWLKGGNL